MINPRRITHWHQKFSSRSHGGKFYRTGFQMSPEISRFSRAKFKTATQAEDYGARLILRWIRLYDAAIRSSLVIQLQ